MKTILLLIIGLIYSLFTFGQTERKYSTYYYQRASLFEQLPISSDDILFIGNSITDGGEWSELFQNPHIKIEESAEIPLGEYMIESLSFLRESLHKSF